MLTKKIAAYLRLDLGKEGSIDYNDRLQVIHFFDESGGTCRGLSLLWGYAMEIGDHSITESQNSPKDDIEFFHKIQKKLNEWDEKTVFTPEEKLDIDRFISNVLLYQSQYSSHGSFKFPGVSRQQDSYKALEDTVGLRNKENMGAGRRLNESFSQERLVMTQNILFARLQKIIHPRSIVFVSLPVLDPVSTKTSSHVVVIYKRETDDLYYLYDINLKIEKTTDKVEKLTKMLWVLLGLYTDTNLESGIFGTKNIKDVFRRLGIQVFRFDKQPENFPYPTHEEYREITDVEFMEVAKAYKEKPDFANDEMLREFSLRLTPKQRTEFILNAQIDNNMKIFLIRSGHAKDFSSLQVVKTILDESVDQSVKQALLSVFLLLNFALHRKKLVTPLLARLALSPSYQAIYIDAQTRVELENIAQGAFVLDSTDATSEWYLGYKAGISKETDTKNLMLTDVLIILRSFTGDKALAEKLLTNVTFPRVTRYGSYGGLETDEIFHNIAKFTEYTIGRNLNQGHIDVAIFVLCTMSKHYIFVNEYGIKRLAGILAQSDKINQADRNALLFAAISANMAEIIPILKEKGIDLNQINDQGMTPLALAAIAISSRSDQTFSNDEGEPNAFTELVTAGADLEAALLQAEKSGINESKPDAFLLMQKTLEVQSKKSKLSM